MSIVTQGFGGAGLVTMGYGISLEAVVAEEVQASGGVAKRLLNQYLMDAMARRRRELFAEKQRARIEIEPEKVEEIVTRAMALPVTSKDAKELIKDFLYPVIPDTINELERGLAGGLMQYQVDIEKLVQSQDALLRILVLERLADEEEFLILLMSEL